MKIQPRELAKNLTWGQMTDNVGKIFRVNGYRWRFVPIYNNVLFISNLPLETCEEEIWKDRLFQEVDESFSLELGDLTITFEQSAA